MSGVRWLLARRFRGMVAALSMLLAVSVLVLAIPWKAPLLELLRHFQLWRAAIAAVLLVLALAFRMRRWALLNFIVLLWQGWPILPSGGGDEARRGKPLRIVTCNLLYEARQPAAMVASLAATNADVIVLQEFTPDWERHCAAALWSRYPYRIMRAEEGPFGICLLSRHPLDSAVIDHDWQGYACARAVVIRDGLRLAILGVHPPPPIGDALHRDWSLAFEAWRTMIAQLDAPHRVVAGDFNATPFCHTMQQFLQSNDLRGSWEHHGVRSTWFHRGLPFLPIGLPIDHILHSPSLTLVNRAIGPDCGSDHRWLSADLAEQR